MGVCDSNSETRNTIIDGSFTPYPMTKNNLYSQNYNNSMNIINNNELNENQIIDGNPQKDDINNIQNEEENHNNEQIIISEEQSEKVVNQSKIYICKIIREVKKDGKNKKQFGTGFLCKIPFPDEFNCLPVLMTNHHVVSEKELLKEKKLTITFNNDKIKKIINITSERKIYSVSKNELYDLTIIEIFPEEDKIFHFLEIDTVDMRNKKINDVIYILQYPRGEESSISYGKICNIIDYLIVHNCSTLGGSSGGPIILLKNYKLIGIHRGTDDWLKNRLNYGSSLVEPLEEFRKKYCKNNIRAKNNYVNCIICDYEIKNGEEIDLIHDFSKPILDIDDKSRDLYIERKKQKKALEDNISIYIDEKLINFSFKYKQKESSIIKVRFIFKEKFNDLSFLFCDCKNLKSMDLSPYNSINVNNMSHMFSGCKALQSIDLFSFNTDKVIDMSYMFSECESLDSLDLSSFNTSKVLNMEKMFLECSSIKKLDLTSFNTINVTNMSKMFLNCYSLKLLFLSSFRTDNVITMERMFSRCSSLHSLNLSSFETSKVVDMEGMFEYCSSLESLNVSSFNTINVKNMRLMFQGCLIVKSLDLSSFNTINVENMHYMFGSDGLLESLDLSYFDSHNVKNMEGIFGGCKNLKTVKCTDHKILEQKNLSNDISNNINLITSS